MADSTVAPRISEALQTVEGQWRVNSYVSTYLGYRRRSDQDLARTIGMSVDQFSRRMLGKIRWTPLEVLAIADEFQVPVDDILNGVPAPPWRFQ